MYRNDSLESEIASGSESNAVSVRVMRIVVCNDGAVQFAMIFKASARAVVIVKSPRYSVRIYARREAGRRSGKCIVNVMSAGNGKIDVCKNSPL